MVWTPRRANPDEHHVLIDGIPNWMASSVGTWLMGHLVVEDLMMGQRRSNIPLMRRFDLDNHTTLADQLSTQNPAQLYRTLTDDEVLDLLDWLVADNAANGRWRANTELEGILARGGSKWKVGMRGDFHGLEERVPSGVQEAAEAVIFAAGDAGRLLAEAWSKTFGRDGDPQGAYNAAVKAVEAAAIPRVIPADRTATLGKVIATIDSQGDWNLGLSRSSTMSMASDTVVLSMMKLLWQGQQRHAGRPIMSRIPRTMQRLL